MDSGSALFVRPLLSLHNVSEVVVYIRGPFCEEEKRDVIYGLSPSDRCCRITQPSQPGLVTGGNPVNLTLWAGDRRNGCYHNPQ